MGRITQRRTGLPCASVPGCHLHASMPARMVAAIRLSGMRPMISTRSVDPSRPTANLTVIDPGMKPVSSEGMRIALATHPGSTSDGFLYPLPAYRGASSIPGPSPEPGPLPVPPRAPPAMPPAEPPGTPASDPSLDPSSGGEASTGAGGSISTGAFWGGTTATLGVGLSVGPLLGLGRTVGSPVAAGGGGGAGAASLGKNFTSTAGALPPLAARRVDTRTAITTSAVCRAAEPRKKAPLRAVRLPASRFVTFSNTRELADAIVAEDERPGDLDIHLTGCLQKPESW
jgi:hypothetical protein